MLRFLHVVISSEVLIWKCRLTCECRRTQMYERTLLPTVESVRDNLLSVAVRIEVDTSGRDHPHKRRSESFEQRRDTFVLVDITTNQN
jgi:hypothetical protein